MISGTSDRGLRIVFDEKFASLAEKFAEVSRINAASKNLSFCIYSGLNEVSKLKMGLGLCHNDHADTLDKIKISGHQYCLDFSYLDIPAGATIYLEWLDGHGIIHRYD